MRGCELVLHELVHTIQHDGQGSCPWWVIESVADHIRLLAHLDPPHWRQPGQGRREKGWDEAYDIGAQFLSWLTIDETESESEPDVEDDMSHVDFERAMSNLEIERDVPDHDVSSKSDIPDANEGILNPHISEASSKPIATSTAAPAAQPTRYPQPGPYSQPQRTDPGAGNRKARRGPFPELVRMIDARLRAEKWDEGWWEEITGASLETLWGDYLDYHA